MAEVPPLIHCAVPGDGLPPETTSASIRDSLPGVSKNRKKPRLSFRLEYIILDGRLGAMALQRDRFQPDVRLYSESKGTQRRAERK